MLYYVMWLTHTDTDTDTDTDAYRKEWDSNYLHAAMSSPLCDLTAIQNLDPDSNTLQTKVITLKSLTCIVWQELSTASFIVD